MFPAASEATTSAHEVQERHNVRQRGKAATASQSRVAPEFRRDKISACAERVVDESSKTNDISDQQTDIYRDCTYNLNRLLDNSFLQATITHNPEPHNRLQESFKRLNNPEQRAREISESIRGVLHSAVWTTDVLKPEEISKSLGTAIGAATENNIFKVFEKDFNKMKERAFLAIKPTAQTWPEVSDLTASETSVSPAVSAAKSASAKTILPSYSHGKVAIQKGKYTSSSTVPEETRKALKRDLEINLDNLNEATKVRLRKLGPDLRTKMKKVVANVLRETQDKTQLPFHLARKLSEETSIPEPLNYQGDTLKPAIKSQAHRAGKYSIGEGLLTNGELVRTPMSTLATTLILTSKAEWKPTTSGWTSVASGLVSLCYVLGRDFYSGYRLMLDNVRGQAITKAFADQCSEHSIARTKLVEAFGARWLSDFEKWARTPGSLSFDEAALVAKEVENEAGHSLLLGSEDQEYRIKGENEAGENPEHERFKGEDEIIDKTFRSLFKINFDANTNPIDKNDYLGIRCLSLLEDEVNRDRAKLLYKLFRSEPIFTDDAGIKSRSDGYLMQKYPITSSLTLSKSKVAKKAENSARLQEEGRAKPTDVQGPKKTKPVKIGSRPRTWCMSRLFS